MPLHLDSKLTAPTRETLSARPVSFAHLCTSFAHWLVKAVAAAETTTRQIENTFKDFTQRDDIGIILISQYVCAHLAAACSAACCAASQLTCVNTLTACALNYAEVIVMATRAHL